MAGRLVFLTGATGFIGGRVARAFLARGDRVRCLVREPRRAAALESGGAELIPGDITDPVALEHGCRNADLAIHLAALYDLGPVDAAEMERVNVDGTADFLRAARNAGVPKTVYISTTAALGPAPNGVGDEQMRWSIPFPSLYHRTKTRAHELALEAQKRGDPVVIVCPAFVYGPGDEGPGGMFLRDLLRGRLPGLLADPAWYSYVYIDDVVAGIIAVCDRGTIGATYVLSGDGMTLNEFAARAARLAGRKPPRLRFPNGLARLTGSLLDRVSRRTGKRFSMSRETVQVSSGHRWVHSHERATQELGYRPRSVAEGLPETIEWLKTR